MKKERIIAFVVTISVLLIAPVFQTAQISRAWPPPTRVDNCVCDHYDNEALLGTPWDMWTAAGITGHCPYGSYFSTVDEQYQSGYGSDQDKNTYNAGIAPLDEYLYIAFVDNGDAYRYSTNYVWDTRYAGSVQCIGYYWDDDYSGTVGSTQSNIASVASSNNFDFVQINGTYYNTQWYCYGSTCTVQAPGGLSPGSGSTPDQIFSPITQTTQSDPMFNVQVSYAYVGQRTEHLSAPNPLPGQTAGATLNAASLYPSLICLNVSRNDNGAIARCDAQIEVYQIQVSADTGATENYILTVGTNVNPSFSNSSQFSALRPIINEFPIAQAANRIEGYFAFNSTVGSAILGTRIGSLGEYHSGSSNMGFWSAGQPATITVSIQRVGYILLRGSTAPTVFSDAQTAPTTQLQLEKLGNGFLYNTVVPQNQLRLESDLFNPGF